MMRTRPVCDEGMRPQILNKPTQKLFAPLPPTVELVDIHLLFDLRSSRQLEQRLARGIKIVTGDQPSLIGCILSLHAPHVKDGLHEGSQDKPGTASPGWL